VGAEIFLTTETEARYEVMCELGGQKDCCIVVGSAVQASLRIRKISLTGPFHSPISFASTTQIQPNTLSIAYDA